MQIGKKSSRKPYWIICIIALIFVLPFVVIPASFADASVVIVQDNSNSQQSANQATCTYGSSVTAHNTLVVGLDAAFINNPVTGIGDSRGDTFTSIGFALNSASTWVRVWESSGIAHSGSDIVTINYTSGSTGSYSMSCDEFQGNVTFTNVGAQGAGLIGCNQCNMNLTGTIHSINLILGWSDSSTGAYTNFAYAFLPGFTAKAGSGSCQAISGSTNCISMFHAESNPAVGIASDSAVILSCSPACNQSPNFEMAFYATLGTNPPVTTTSSQDTLLISGSINEAVGFVEWLIPSLIILFMFTWLGLKAGAGTEVILILEIFAFAIIGVIGILFSPAGFWPPFWTAFLGIVFCIVGLAYSKGRTH